MTTIVKWAAIQKHFSQGLIMGNGASIGISDRFNYPSLYQAAQDGNFLTGATRAVFTSFGSTDFELVLRRLWQATLVNKALQIGNKRVDQAYAEVRKSLISTVHAIHPAYDEVKKHSRHGFLPQGVPNGDVGELRSDALLGRDVE